MNPAAIHFSIKSTEKTKKIRRVSLKLKAMKINPRSVQFLLKLTVHTVQVSKQKILIIQNI